MLLRIWDTLFLLLLLFPLVTGGAWIRRPGLAIELSELSVPVMILAAFAWGMHRRGIPVGRSYFVRKCKQLWSGWTHAVELMPLRLLGLVALAAGSLMWLVSLRRHWALESHAFDVGIFTNAIWNLVNGNGYVSSPKEGINLFADHQSPIFWLMAPAFAAVPRPETLFFIQSFGLAFGGVSLFFLAAQYLGRKHWLPFALPLIYWSYLPIRNANAFEFHPETMMLPLFLWGIVGVQSLRAWPRALGTLALIVALGGKESAGPVAFGIGLAWMLGGAPAAARRFTRIYGAIYALVGLVIFYIDVALVPNWVGKGYAYQSLYSQYGNSVTDMLTAPLLKPEIFWPQLLGASRLKYLFWTLFPLGLLPLANPRVSIAAFPGFAMLFLSQGDHRISTQYHYIIEPGVGLFWAIPGAVAWLETRGRTIAFRLPFWVLFWTLVGFGRSEMYRVRIYEPGAHARWFRSELVPTLNPSLPTAASEAFVPHLATRPWIHGLDRLEMGPLDAPEGPVTCIVWDDSVSNWPMSHEQVLAAYEAALKTGFHEIYRCGSTRVLSLGYSSSLCMVKGPSCPKELGLTQ